MSLRYEAWTLPWDSGGFKRVVAKIHEIEGTGSGKVAFLGSTGDGQVTISVAKLEEAGRSLSEIISDTTSSLIRVYDTQADGTNTIIDEWVTERVERVHSDDDRRVKISGPILKEKAFDGAIVYPLDYPAAVSNPALQDHIWGGNNILSNPGMEDPTEVPSTWEIWTDHTAGTFTVSDGTDTTDPMLFDILPGLMETRLETDLGTITDVHVTGVGSEDDPWVIEWVDPINDTFIDNITLTANFGSLSGGTESRINETQVGHLVPSGWTKSQTVSRGVTQVFGTYDNFQLGTTTVDTGTYSLLVNPGAIPAHDGWLPAQNRYAGAQQVVNVEPGLTYQASIRINPVSGTDTYRFVIRDVNGGFIASDSGGLGSNTYTASTWSTATISNIVIPAGVDQIIFRFANTNNSGNPSGFRLDNAVLSEGLAATTWGDIIQVLMDDAAVDHASDDRGPVLDWVDYTGFDDTNDSTSVAWARDESYTARFGQLYGQVFDDGVDLGYEWNLVPKTTPAGGLTHDLDWYNTDNLDAAPSTAINVKQAVTGGQVTRRIPDFTSVIVEGADGEYIEDVDPGSAETDFGHLEKYDLSSQLSSTNSITARKDQLFAAEAANRTAVQFTIIETPDHPRPLVTYVPGDTLPMQLPPDLAKVTRRVQEIAYVNTFPTQYTVTGSRILTGEAAAYDLIARLWRKFDKPAIQRRGGAVGVSEGGGGGGAPTLTVAASDAIQESKDKADFECTGTNDHTTINLAVSTLPSNGGRILLTEGTFTIGASIELPDNTQLQGMGYGTKITIPNSHNANIDAITEKTGAGANIWVTDLALNGNDGNQSSGTMRGINIVDVFSVEVRNVAASDWRTCGVRIAAASANDYQPTVENCEISDNYGLGLEMVNINNMRVSDNELRDNVSDGITLTDCAAGTLSDGYVRDITGGMGVALDGCSSMVVSGLNILTIDEHGLYMNDTSNCLITGLRISSVGQATDETWDGIHLVGDSNNNSIVLNSFFPFGAAPDARYLINISASTCDDNWVALNNLDPDGSNPPPFITGMLNDAGTGTDVVPGNKGPGFTSTDADAIHDNVASEISAITEKTVPVNADLMVIEDSAASNAKKRVQLGNLPFGAGGSGGPPTSVLAGFGENDLAASLTDSQLYRNVQGTQLQIPIVVAHAGDVVGITVASSEARTAGTATFEVFIDGTGTGLTTVLNGTDTQYASNTQAPGSDSFVADNRLDVRVTTDGSWAPTTADVEATIVTAGAQYGAVIRATTDQSISAATQTEVDFGAAVTDVGSVADTGNNGFTVPTGAAGLWLVTAVMSFEDAIGTDLRIIYVVNDTDQNPFGVRYMETNADFGMKPGAVMPLNLADGDTVTIDTHFTDAGNLRGAASISTVDTWAAMWRA